MDHTKDVVELEYPARYRERFNNAHLSDEVNNYCIKSLAERAASFQLLLGTRRSPAGAGSSFARTIEVYKAV